MSEITVETYERAGFTVKIIVDEDPPHPRKDFDNEGTMACAHGRYDLGDKDGIAILRSAIQDSKSYKKEWDEEDLDDLPTLDRLAQECEDIISLPLYLLDHSGITMSTGSFNDTWDSGKVGIIFISRENVLKAFHAKRLTKQLRKRAVEMLESEVKTYDLYLRGDVYGYTIEEANGETIDSCWGFFDFDFVKEEANSQADFFAKDREVKNEANA